MKGVTTMWKEKGIIVSCQADKHGPLYGPQFMAEMAEAAVQGGAIGIRANGVADIAYIKERVNVPIIGLNKKRYPGYIPFITPTLEDALAVAYSGAEVIAIDCSKHDRPDGLSLKETIESLKEQTKCKIMADIATIEEAKYAYESGADYLGTTLHGYTEETKNFQLPGFSLMEQLVSNFPIPVIAEGGISTKEHIEKAFSIGVNWIVIGTAITSPREITKDLVTAVHQ